MQYGDHSRGDRAHRRGVIGGVTKEGSVPCFVWLIIAVLALAGELVSTAFVLVYVGVAAAITAILAAVGLPPVLQLVVFIPLTLALLLVVRPQTVALLCIKEA